MSVKTVTQYLGLNVRDGTTPQAKRIRGVGTSNNLGPTFGTLDSGGSGTDQPINRIVFFNGAMIATVGSGIYRSVDGALSWSLVYTLPSINTSTAFKSGLNVVAGNNVIYLCLIYFDASNPRGAKSTDGINWTVDGPFTSISSTQSSLFSDTVFQNQLWCLSSLANQAGMLLAYSPGASQMNSYSFAISITGLSATTSLVEFNDTLMVTTTTNTAVRSLYMIDGGRLSLVVSFGTFTGSTNSGAFKPSFLVDDSFLYVFTLKNVGATWACWQVDSSYNVTDVTSSVIPSGMTGATPAGSESRTLTFVDTDWAPGTNPPKYLIHSNNGTSGTSMSLYAWQGPSTTMLLLDTGGNVAQAFSICKFPTASGFFIVGPPVCVIQAVTPSTTENGLVIAFIIQGPTTAYFLRVRLWYGGNTDEYLTSIGTLSNPNIGTLNPTNTAVTGLLADNITVYNFTWLPPSSIIGTNGVGTRYKFGLEALI